MGNNMGQYLLPSFQSLGAYNLRTQHSCTTLIHTSKETANFCSEVLTA